jgi:malate permease and related proteins
VLDVLVDVILPVMIVAVVGGVVGRRLGVQLKTLSDLVFYVFSPALVFTGLSTVKLQGSAVGRIAVVSVGVFVLNAAIALTRSRIRSAPPDERATVAVASAVPNLGNMGLPMSKLAFGQPGLEIGTVLFTFGVVLNASAAIALGRFAQGQHTRRAVLLAPLRYPTIYAAVAGVTVNLLNVDLPTVVTESTGTLAAASIPCMLVVLGLSFHVPRLDDLHDPIFVSVNRLVLGPVLAWGIALAVGLHGTARHVTIMMAGMPVAVNTTILAAQLRADVPLSVRIVVVSTLLSVIALTGLITVL